MRTRTNDVRTTQHNDEMTDISHEKDDDDDEDNEDNDNGEYGEYDNEEV